MIETLLLYDRKKKRNSNLMHCCILIKTIDCSMPYFPAPPISEDCEFPEFLETMVEVYFVNTYTGKCKHIKSRTMRKLYKFIDGARDRKFYWHIMKYHEYIGQ